MACECDECKEQRKRRGALIPLMRALVQKADELKIEPRALAELFLLTAMATAKGCGIDLAEFIRWAVATCAEQSGCAVDEFEGPDGEVGIGVKMPKPEPEEVKH